MQQHIVLQRVQADDQIGLDGGAVLELRLEAGLLAVQLIYDFLLGAAQDLLAVGQGARRPFVEQVAAAGHFGGLDDGAGLAFAGADEEDQAAARGDAFDYFAGAAQVGGCDVEGDDVDGIVVAAHAENVLCVHRVPEGSCVAEVRLRGHQELEGHILRFGRVGEQFVRFVVLDRGGA